MVSRNKYEKFNLATVLSIKVINCLKNWVRSLYPYDTEGM